MLVKTALLLVSCSLAVAVAAPLAQPDDLVAKQFIDNPRFGGRDSTLIEERDETDSVRITGVGSDAAPIEGRDDTDSVRITGVGGESAPIDERDETDSVRITRGGQGGYYVENIAPRDGSGEQGPDPGHEWGFVPIKARDDGPGRETDWGKVKRGDGGPEDRREQGR
ncbi:hypothetical protein B0T16DRAFT_421488 [Cercophora newfieldiana]|uniref:Uncharacterized protein n=1 Tax=Cercophora newfieldiana TaxID=92897 RepID=A0AA40CHI1_9PEZI|nr:hypothetical protein B0T16DRAFT_421488 [Cercophora newfieldiana]